MWSPLASSLLELNFIPEAYPVVFPVFKLIWRDSDGEIARLIYTFGNSR